MSASQSRQRTESVMVRLTPEERARFAALAEQNRMTLPEMFRLAASFAEAQAAMQEASR